jgi:hypothetical protein
MSVVSVGANPYVQVTGKTGFRVLDNSITADHQISNVVVFEKTQQIAEVGVDEHLTLSPWQHEG